MIKLNDDLFWSPFYPPTLIKS